MGVKLDVVNIEDKIYSGVILGYSGENFSEKVILNSVMWSCGTSRNDRRAFREEAKARESSPDRNPRE